MTTKIEPVTRDSDYAELAAKKDQSAEKRNVIRKERDTIVERMRAEQQEGRPVPRNHYAEKIAAIALGRPVPDNRTPDDVRLNDLNKKLRELDDIVEFLAGQMRATAAKASVVAAHKALPDFNKLKDNMVSAVLQAHAAKTAIDRFLNDFEDAGYIRGHLPDVRPNFIETGKHGTLAYWLDGLSKEKIIARGLIPAELDFRK